MQPLRVGVVGTSWWADWMHLPSLKSHPHAQISAICGRDRARADAMASKYGIRQVFTDYREMIEQADLQALIVSVPDDLHYAITMAALAAGLHVLCEKPLASTAKQAREMYETAATAGVKHVIYRAPKGGGLHGPEGTPSFDTGYLTTHDPGADTIGRMTPAGCGTTAHQDRTAQARIASRADRSAPCRNWYHPEGTRYLIRLRCGRDHIRRCGEASGKPAPPTLRPNGINH